jgi:hypothetical protein
MRGQQRSAKDKNRRFHGEGESDGARGLFPQSGEDAFARATLAGQCPLASTPVGFGLASGARAPSLVPT